MLSHRIPVRFPVLAAGIYLAFTLSICGYAQPRKSTGQADGLVWDLTNSWQIAGKPLLKGDAVPPGSLLQPAISDEPHTIAVFLPDGQRQVYECYKVEDCGRGFRIPHLYAVPDPAAVQFLAGVGEVLKTHRAEAPPPAEPSGPPGTRLPYDEALVVVDQSGLVHVGGLATKLPNGHYTYNLRPLDPSQSRRFQVGLEKDSPLITVAVPSPGIYSVTIFDDAKRARIEMFVAAVTPEQKQQIDGPYSKAAKLIAQFNENYPSWPAHDLKRAWLEWLILGPKGLSALKASTAKGQTSTPAPTTQSGPAPAKGSSRLEAAAEPTYSPNPGIRNTETDVSLHCDTPGATIHYTLDGSQPMTMSAVYHAPIVVQSTEMTIKAFASAPGKKDSPVVTGTFRIEEGKKD
jgi:hypothetical protein